MQVWYRLESKADERRLTVVVGSTVTVMKVFMNLTCFKRKKGSVTTIVYERTTIVFLMKMRGMK